MDITDIFTFGGLLVTCIGLSFLFSWPLGLTVFGAVIFILGIIGGLKSGGGE